LKIDGAIDDRFESPSMLLDFTLTTPSRIKLYDTIC